MTDDQSVSQIRRGNGKLTRFVNVIVYCVVSIVLGVLITFLIFMFFRDMANNVVMSLSVAWLAYQWEGIWKALSELFEYVMNAAEFKFVEKLWVLAMPFSVLILWSHWLVAGAQHVFYSSSTYINAVNAFYSGVVFARSGDDAERPHHMYLVVDASDGAGLGGLEHAIFPLRFNNAKLLTMPTGPIASIDPSTLPWEPGERGGVSVTDEHRRELTLLLRAFGPCTSDDRNPVVFNVSGFASSLHFARAPSVGMSDELNLAAANQRGSNVEFELDEIASKLALEGRLNRGGFDAQHTPYNDPASMRQDWRYDDRPYPFGANNEAEVLNRSVTITVESAGACSLT